ncbi:MAG TPA: minichromosome maintenance protein MCM [Nanoarchaeota archaeon]|nr:minichromosome maintenance protein MCM [Nanoarchaeota archaeon]
MAIDKFELEELFETFIENFYESDLREAATKGKESIPIDFSKLAKFNPAAAEQLLDKPRGTIDALETAMIHRMRNWINGLSAKQLAQVKHIGKYNLGKLIGISNINARLLNIPDSQKVQIKSISKEHIGKLIIMEGNVIKQSKAWLEPICSKFECPSCGSEMLLMQAGNGLKKPSECACGHKSCFKQLKTIFIDVQELILQDLSHDAKKKGAQICVIVRNDLAGAEMSRDTAEGKRIRVCGIVEEEKRISKHSHKIPNLIVNANNIEPI